MITLEEIRNNEVRALWVKQPYPSAFLYGKYIETRVWDTKYRGLVLICSTAKPYTIAQVESIAGAQQFARLMCELAHPATYKEMPMSQSICIARLVDSRPMLMGDVDAAYVNYQPQLYSHVYEHITPVQPMYMKGRLGWYTLPPKTRMDITL